MSKILEKLDELNEARQLFEAKHKQELASVKSENEGLRTRVEELESKRGAPGLTGTGTKKELDYKVLPTSNGNVYELPSTTKMVDVLPPEKEPEISLGRWLGATIAGERCHDKEALTFARDQKAMTTASTGVLIPAQYVSQWIDLLRAQMVLNACGIRTATMDNKTQIRSAVTVDPTAGWHTEGSSISAANPTFASRTLTATTLVVRCQATVELAQDSPDFGQQLGAVMTRAMAAEMDRVGIIGSGTPPQPLGIVGTSGIGAVTGGSITDFSKFVTAVQTLLTAGVPLDVATRNIIINPYVWGKLENLATGISSDKTQLQVPRSLRNTNWRVTTSLPNNSPFSDTAVLGNFEDLIMGIRRDPSIEILKLDTYSGNLILEFIAFARLDFIVTRPASFCKITALV